MTQIDEQTLKNHDPTQIIDSRLQLHWAAQALGQWGLSYGEPREDWLHYALCWDPASQSFKTRPLQKLPNHGFSALELHFEPLRLQLHKTQAQAPEFLLEGVTQTDIQDWLSEKLNPKELAKKPLKEIPHDMPEHAVQTGAAFTPNPEKLKLLQQWFQLAHTALTQVQNAFHDQPPLVCWPHHFDLAALQKYPEVNTGEVNAGFSPGDSHYNEPYFYVTPWPHPELESLNTAILPALPEGSFWRTKGWFGAILKSSSLIQSHDLLADTQHFLNSAVAASQQIVHTQ